MKKIYLGLLISLFSTAVHAQDVHLNWARSSGGTSQDWGWAITTDASGNVYVTGGYRDTVDFDPDTTIFNLSSNGGMDIFIQKLDAAGNFIWAKSIGGGSNDQGFSITTDISGNVLITGYFQDTADFDPGASIFYLTSNGNQDIFILKLDASGNFIWAKSIGGILADVSLSITTDASSNVYITGHYEDTADFDPGAATINLTSNGDYDIFIQKLDGTGNFIWAKSVGGTLGEVGYDITADALDNVLITGYYWLTVDFDPSGTTFNLTTNGLVDVFIQKLDAGGNFVWAKSMGGTSSEVGLSITTSASGDVYATGRFLAKADFDPGAATFDLIPNGASDIFIVKLDTAGDFIWAKSMGGTAAEEGRSIITDDSGNVLITGWYQSTVDFDPSATVFNLSSSGLLDVFVQKLDSNGNFIWAKSMGGTSDDRGYSIATDTGDIVYITGTFRDTADFDSGASSFDLISNGVWDVFILKLSELIVGIEENTLADNVFLYPNPTQGLVNIDLGNLQDVSIKVLNVSGQLVYHEERINNSIHQFELNEPAGIYFVEISSAGGRQQYKLVKELE
ncbi:MAG: T9SS type A sorting domain-containing protein [Bacteroidetes bacterium]|nr:T9SS type A sorting domain-containing protein [Bacteroidota bacterium]